MSESLEKELSSLQSGKLDSSGKFTLDPVAARRRLAEFEMPDPELWLARALEALVASGVKTATYLPGGGGSIEIQADFQPQLALNLEKLLDYQYRDPVASSLRSALLTGTRLQPAELSYSWRSAEGGGLELLHKHGERSLDGLVEFKEFDSQLEQPGVSLVFRPKRSLLEISTSSQAHRCAGKAAARFRFSHHLSVFTHIADSEFSSTWRIETEFPKVNSRCLAVRAYLPVPGDPDIISPPISEICYYQFDHEPPEKVNPRALPVLWQDRGAEGPLGEHRPAEQQRSQSLTQNRWARFKDDFLMRERRPGQPLKAILALPLKAEGPTRVVVVRHGLYRQLSIDYDLFWPGALVVFCSDQIDFDLSGFGVVQNEKLERLLHFFRLETRELAGDVDRLLKKERRLLNTKTRKLVDPQLEAQPKTAPDA